MQATITRVGVVVPALIALCRTSLPSWQVLDGPRAAQELADDILVVGTGNADTAEAYSSELDVQAGLTERLQERIAVHCEISTWNGDQDNGVPTLRSKLVTALGVLDGAFRADQHLAGTCDRVYLGGAPARWYVLQSPAGPGMGVEFDVTVLAWI